MAVISSRTPPDGTTPCTDDGGSWLQAQDLPKLPISHSKPEGRAPGSGLHPTFFVHRPIDSGNHGAQPLISPVLGYGIHPAQGVKVASPQFPVENEAATACIAQEKIPVDRTPTAPGQRESTGDGGHLPQVTDPDGTGQAAEEFTSAGMEAHASVAIGMPGVSTPSLIPTPPVLGNASMPGASREPALPPQQERPQDDRLPDTLSPGMRQRMAADFAYMVQSIRNREEATSGFWRTDAAIDKFLREAPAFLDKYGDAVTPGQRSVLEEAFQRSYATAARQRVDADFSHLSRSLKALETAAPASLRTRLAIDKFRREAQVFLTVHARSLSSEQRKTIEAALHEAKPGR
jgi:hypothetical protein